MTRPDGPVRVAAIFVGIAYVVALWWAGVALDGDIRKVLAYIPSVAVLGLVAWDVQVWRWPLVHLITARPRVDGLWEATLQPTEESHIPVGGNRGPIRSYLAISQSYWRLHATLITRESHSLTQSHYWFGTANFPVEWVTFIYENAPQQQYRQRSPRHLGACTLRPGSKTPTSMSASYFTDRYTQGDIDLTLIGRDGRVAAFDEAEAKAAQLRTKAQAVEARRSTIRGYFGLGRS